MIGALALLKCHGGDCVTQLELMVDRSLSRGTRRGPWSRAPRRSMAGCSCSGGPTARRALARWRRRCAVIDGAAWYHLSVAIGRRCTHLPRVLRAFGMEGAEEDNDGAKASRNFWLAVEAGKDAA